jgi:hypothetical protein
MEGTGKRERTIICVIQRELEEKSQVKGKQHKTEEDIK